jgi:hypothetical protein
MQDAEVQAVFLMRIISRKMFLRRIDYVKFIENERFLVNEVFPYQNFKILKYFWNKKCSLSMREF